MNETALVVSAASRANFILNRYRKPVAPIENEAQFHSQQELCMRISPLRQRMPGDKNLAAFIGRPPETATAEDLRLYRLHLVQSPLGAASVNSYLTALRFFFSITPGLYDLLKPLFRVEQPRKLPTVPAARRRSRRKV
jgi:hypothetical protein